MCVFVVQWYVSGGLKPGSFQAFERLEISGISVRFFPPQFKMDSGFKVARSNQAKFGPLMLANQEAQTHLHLEGLERNCKCH